jgi:hypothetical protein
LGEVPQIGFNTHFNNLKAKKEELKRTREELKAQLKAKLNGVNEKGN